MNRAFSDDDYDPASRRRARADQDEDDVFAAQRFGELTDGSYRTIGPRGVRQHGTSDAEAGTQIRSELASRNKGPSTASVTQEDGTVVDPYKPTGFQGSGMNGKPGFQLRTGAEVAARIAESRAGEAARRGTASTPISSTRSGTTNDTERALADANRAKVQFGGAPQPGNRSVSAVIQPQAPAFAGTSGQPTYTNLPPDPFQSPAGQSPAAAPAQTRQDRLAQVDKAMGPDAVARAKLDARGGGPLQQIAKAAPNSPAPGLPGDEPPKPPVASPEPGGMDIAKSIARGGMQLEQQQMTQAGVQGPPSLARAKKKPVELVGTRPQMPPRNNTSR